MLDKKDWFRTKAPTSTTVRSTKRPTPAFEQHRLIFQRTRSRNISIQNVALLYSQRVLNTRGPLHLFFPLDHHHSSLSIFLPPSSSRKALFASGNSWMTWGVTCQVAAQLIFSCNPMHSAHGMHPSISWLILHERASLARSTAATPKVKHEYVAVSWKKS